MIMHDKLWYSVSDSNWSDPTIIQHELFVDGLGSLLPSTHHVRSAAGLHTKYVVYADQYLCVYVSDTQ